MQIEKKFPYIISSLKNLSSLVHVPIKFEKNGCKIVLYELSGI